jgi:TolB protein
MKQNYVWLSVLIPTVLFVTKFESSERRLQIATASEEIMFVSNRDGNNEIYLMSADGSNQRNLTNNAADDHLPVWSPDGSEIAFTSDRNGNNEIWIMDTSGLNPRNLTNDSSQDWLPTWSPDGKLIAFMSSRDESKYQSPGMYLMNTDTAEIERVATVRYNYIVAPAWSPDSKYFIFFSEQYGIGNAIESAWETIRVNVETLTSHVSDFYSQQPYWSPDGRYIMLGECSIVVMNEDGTDRHLSIPEYSFQVSDDNFMCIVPYGWSPDNHRIVFSVNFRGYNEDNQAGLYIADDNGRNVRQLTYEDVAYDAKWSPDGHYLVYVSERQIYVVNVETKKVLPLTDVNGDNESPVWRPRLNME